MATSTQLELTIVGLLPDETFHAAKSCAQDLYQQNPDKFATPDIRGLLEFEWDLYVEAERKSQKGEVWAFNDKSMAYLNGQLIGGPSDLLKWAADNFNFEDFRPSSLYQAIAEEAYKTYLQGTRHTFVYYDVSIGGESAGRLILELYTDKCPKTCENFRALCTGEKGQSSESTSIVSLHFKDSLFHRIVPNGWLQGGDIVFGKGDGGQSIYGEVFEDENYAVAHNSRGILGMANQGRHTNGSQFYITFQPAPWMDTKYVAFGKVIEGTQLLKTLEGQETYNERPKKDCKIVACGIYAPWQD